RVSQLRRVLSRQQSGERDVDESWIAVIAFPVGERELDRLGDQVNVAGAVIPEILYALWREDRQGLQQRRALAPRCRRRHLPIPELGRDRGFDLGFERFQVGGCQPAITLLG